MNIIYYPVRKRIAKYIISYSVSLIIVIISIIVSLAILLWKKSIDAADIRMNNLITAVNTVQIVIFNILYQKLAIYLNDLENHSTAPKYRNSLIMKLFMFSFANTFNSMFLIAFFKPYIDYFGVCVQQKDIMLEGVDCFNELTIQVRFVFIVQFCLSFLRIIIPLLQNRVFKMFESKWPIKNYPWKLIDREIEKESKKNSYVTTLQVDGTLHDIMRMMMEFTFLCLFSISFPLAYLIAFIGGIFDVHIEKFKLAYFYKRPLPQSSKNIGIWHFILEFVLMLTIFSNAAIFSFTLKGIQEKPDIETQVTTFLIILIIFFSMKLLFQLLISDIPENFMIILKRHKRITDNILNKEFQTFSMNVRAGVYLNLNNNIKDDFLSED